MIMIAGPCVIESEKRTMFLAERLQNISEKYHLDFYFKASFDKANRTSIKSFRGPGIDEGLRVLSKVKENIGAKIATDIHESWQAKTVAEVADIIQIPAFLCRQTDLLIAAAKTGRTVNVKKAQFLAPWDMRNVVQKLNTSGCSNIMLCERGTSFGYNNLVVDMTGIIELKKLGCPVIFDATHSVQKPGGNGDSSNGNREYVQYLARAAAAVGVDGFFMEVHDNPEEALSDGPNMITPNEFELLIDKLLKIESIVVD